VRKISLLFGFFEGFRAAWHHDVNWPMKRRAMLAEGREARRARIRQHAIDMGMRWSQKVDLPSYEHFRGSEKVRALEFLLEALQRRNAQALMLLPPWPNQGLVDVAFSPRGRQALTLIREHTLRYARERKVRVLALDDPEVLQKLGPFDWDDLEHLSTQRSSALIADAIAGALPAAASKP
jgi:hypothetical protein